jgi:hypothetical protein
VNTLPKPQAPGQRPPAAPPGRSQRPFLVAHNPDPASRLPYLLRLPLEGGEELVLATAATWPAVKDVFCYQLQAWPEDARVLESVAVERCWRAGAAVHLVLRRRQARRSLFVWTQSRGRTLIFWRSRATMRTARPGIRVPQARGLERSLHVAVDVHERYPWRFRRYGATSERRELPVGDYALLAGGSCVAAVERKSAADLCRSAVGGQLALVLAELGRLPHAALVVEGRLSDVIKEGQRGGVQPGRLLNLLAALQVTHPRVAWVFGETRALAEDDAYRWLAAAAGAAPDAAPARPDAAGAEDDPYPGPAVLDAAARRRLAVTEARAGVVWTTASFAARCGVTQVTAWKDLRALVAAGLLQAEGERRTRRYRAAAD